MITWGVTPAYTYGLETMALTEKREKVHVCENNWIRIIMGVKRADKLDKLRVDVGIKQTADDVGDC